MPWSKNISLLYSLGCKLPTLFWFGWSRPNVTQEYTKIRREHFHDKENLFLSPFLDNEVWWNDMLIQNLYLYYLIKNVKFHLSCNEIFALTCKYFFWIMHSFGPAKAMVHFNRCFRLEFNFGISKTHNYYAPKKTIVSKLYNKAFVSFIAVANFLP